MPRQYTPRVSCVCRYCGVAFTAQPRVIARGGGKYCSQSCYYADRKNTRTVDPLVRFWASIHKTDTCWLWIGYVTKEGYGLFWNGTQQVLAHRFAYELLVGPIPKGLEIDHVRAWGCTNRHCVRPDHLEPVTHAENLLRGDAPAAQNLRKTHCVNGHEFTPENTFVRPSGRRTCLACLARANPGEYVDTSYCHDDAQSS